MIKKDGLFVEGEFFESSCDIFGRLKGPSKGVDDDKQGIRSKLLDGVQILIQLMLRPEIDWTLDFEPDDIRGSA